MVNTCIGYVHNWNTDSLRRASEELKKIADNLDSGVLSYISGGLSITLDFQSEEQLVDGASIKSPGKKAIKIHSDLRFEEIDD